MLYVGVDLHKKSITLCVLNQERKLICRRRLLCRNTEGIRKFFGELDTFRVVVEATASYEWFVEIVEPMADEVVLAHPKKLRVIAESTRKSDKLDATVLAQFLALDMIPRAYRPTPRQRQHRVLVRHRNYLQRRITSVKNKLHRILANDNADRPDLFTQAGRKYLDSVRVSNADRFAVDQLTIELDLYRLQLTHADRTLAEFARSAPIAEKEAREILDSIPQVGTVTIDVVLSELGNPRRFRSQKKAVAYAGLAPGQRESAGKRKDLHIEKNGSRLLRWALIEAAWRLVGKTARWKAVYDRLQPRVGKKRAIVAVARRLLCVMISLLNNGQRYRHGLAMG